MNNTEELAEMLEKNLSQVIQDTLEKRGVSQTQFAKELSISQSNLNRLLRNEISYRVSHLIEIAGGLHMTIQKLISLAEENLAKQTTVASLDGRRRNVSEVDLIIEELAANPHKIEEDQPSYDDD